jgi:hypothetical protein
MTTYYIYHIPGVKFGCTIDLERRKSEYPKDVQDLIVLHETIVSDTPLEPSKREKILNIHFGYPVGFLYVVSVAAAKKKMIEAEKAAIRRRILKNVNRNLPPILRRPFRVVRGVCPHCGQETTVSVLKRQHLDACPANPERR